MANVSFLQKTDEDLRLIFDVVQVLTPLAQSNPAVPPLIERLHALQNSLLQLRATITQES